LPLSAAAISIGIGFLVLLWPFTGRWRDRRIVFVENPLYWAIAAFAIVHLLGLMWSHDAVNGFKSWMVFLIPLLATVVDKATAEKGVYYFLAGMMVAEVGSYYKIVENWSVYISGGYNADMFLAMGHISYNSMLALSIGALITLLIYRQLQGWKLIASALFVVTMTVNMFMTGGRAGQVALLFVFVFFAVMYLKNNRMALFGALWVVVFAFSGAYVISPVFKQRADMAVMDVNNYNENPNTSVGLRMKFAENSWALVKESPWIGHGTGSFESSYARINKERSPNLPATSNPHNNHVLILVQFGLLGFMVYLSIFVIMFLRAIRMPNDYVFRPMALLIPPFYFLICFSDSYLWGHHTQALFALLTASIYRRDMYT
jgi:O-antigen ligase